MSACSPTNPSPKFDALFRSKPTTSSNCETGSFLKVGYPIDDDELDRFVEQMEICFDEQPKVDAPSGYMYACKVEDFKRKVRFLPEPYVNGLLEK